jgi:hypothetical protein
LMACCGANANNAAIKRSMTEPRLFARAVPSES